MADSYEIKQNQFQKTLAFHGKKC